MKSNKKAGLIVTVLSLLVLEQAKAGNIIINGGFETNSAGSTQFNLSNASFSATVANATGFGTANEIDLFTPDNDYYMTPQAGNWSVVLHKKIAGNPDAFSFNLSSPVLSGTSYLLSFYAFSDRNIPSQVLIGLSNSATNFGTQVFSATPSMTNWQHFTYSFTPNINALFFTVSAGATLNGVTNVDSFSLTPSTSVSIPEPSSILLLAGWATASCFRRKTRLAHELVA